MLLNKIGQYKACVKLKVCGPNEAHQVILCGLRENLKCMIVLTYLPIFILEASALHLLTRVETASYPLTPNPKYQEIQTT